MLADEALMSIHRRLGQHLDDLTKEVEEIEEQEPKVGDLKVPITPRYLFNDLIVPLRGIHRNDARDRGYSGAHG